MPQRDLLDIMLRRQKVLADFADFALQSDDLDEVLQEACRLVAAAMGTERAKVLEIEEDGDSLFLRAGSAGRRATSGTCAFRCGTIPRNPSPSGRASR